MWNTCKMTHGVSLFQAVFNKSNVTEEKETAQFDFQIYIFTKFISLFILSKDFQVFHKKLPEHDAMIHPKLIFLNTETPPLH